LERLPVRFRNYIQKLENRVETLERERPPNTATNVAIKSYERDERYRYLPQDSRISFFATPYIGDHHYIEVFNRKDGGTGVEIYGSDALDIRPNSSNVFYVSLAIRGRER
jgi:hypothetical protein